MNQLFKKITQLMMHLDISDIMAMSELADEIANLVKACSTDEKKRIAQDAHNLVLDTLKKGSSENFIPDLTKILDTLQTQINLDENANTNINKSNGSDISLELINNFVVESNDRLSNAQNLILTLEDDPSNMNVISELFRIFHTIKGECGFLKLFNLAELTHVVENILDMLRNEIITSNEEVINYLLHGLDLSKEVLSEIQLNGHDKDINKSKIKKYTEELIEAKQKIKPNLGEIMIKNSSLKDDEITSLLKLQKQTGFTKKIGEIATEEGLSTHQEIEEYLNLQLKKEDTTTTKKEPHDQIIKVKASKINYIVDMIGELIIASDQIPGDSPALLQTRKITKLLQYAGMQLRTESIKPLISNSRRLIRDVAKKTGKEIHVNVIGEDLEIDRNLIEHLEEPMIHLLRNSVHHGIESADERIKKGKTPHGNITIAAQRKAITLSYGCDDGVETIKKNYTKAIEKQIVSQNDLISLTDNQIYNLIFTSGFSTAANIDQISGRGVGMDIVKNAIESNKGRIEIQTIPHEYTKFILIFPLSTAIIDGMILRINDSLFILPISSIIESIKLKSSEIHKVNYVPIYKLRNEVYSIISLTDLFESLQSNVPCEIGIVVESSNGKQYLILAHEIISKKEVVIKSLGKTFAHLKGISSGCILEEGKIGLVLDVDQIVDIAANNTYKGSDSE